jgi:predicted dithiol-disulfide oxidoreductase (DUF899 family)
MVSRAPLARIEPFRQRMGWAVPWYSSFGSDFNYDFHVTLDQAVAPVEYNYRNLASLGPEWQGWTTEMHGISAFLRRGWRPRLPHLLQLRARHRPGRWASITGSISPPEAAKKTGSSHPGAATAP